MKKVIFILAVFAGILILLNCGGDDVVNVSHDIKVVLYPVADTSVFFSDTLEFQAYVWNTTDTTVKWYVNNIENGNGIYGTIDSTGKYFAPAQTDGFDEVTVKIVSIADSTKSDSTVVYILDRDFIYVNVNTGDDVTGIGSEIHPFKTIGKGISIALNGQIILADSGTYNAASGESFPLIPTRDVTIQGVADSSVIVEPPDDQPAFSLQYERAAVKNLTIRRSTKTGVGVEFAGLTGLGRVSANTITIENCRIAALVVSAADTVGLINAAVDSCTYGVLVQDPALLLDLSQSSFTNIDSIAVETISPVSNTLDFNYVTVDNSWIGLNLVQASFAFIHNSQFSNIESTAVFLNARATINKQGTSGPNDFSGCQNWCVINNTPDSIYAVNNTWPAADSATIDNQYIYDDTQDATKGRVYFIPFN